MQSYTIKEVSAALQIPASTLRYYEEEGLLPPVQRAESGHRFYTQVHINRLHTLLCFKGTGMSLAQLKTFFIYEDNEQEHLEDMVNLLAEQKAKVEKQLLQLQQDFTHIQRKLDFFTDIKKAADSGKPRPGWQDYRNRVYQEKGEKA